MEVKRSASARRLQEVEAQVASMEEGFVGVPPVPVMQQRVDSGVGGLQVVSQGQGQGNVRASQIGMAC